ncbi:TPA: FRG domain-containing protein, partial [Pasteurella multocida]|nr:FRG domain-containing protein [Pasteurella multocida]
MEINSIKDLIDFLKDIGEPQSGYSRFFRGHSDHEWIIEPSIYRSPKKIEGKPQERAFIENEDNIIRDAIVNSPDDFSDKDSIFSILVKLQHYGYPTRLLDLTTNALVALYFAVKSFNDKDGELFLFDIPNSEVKYFDSDTVSILSALSLRKGNFRIDGFKSFSKMNSLLKKLQDIP